MMIDQVLEDAGVLLEDIETKLEGQNGKTLLITKRELLYIENSRVQRGRLREIINVKTAKTGELNVKSPTDNLIEGNIKGFDLSELKFFFESVKGAIARAKASVTGTDIPVPKAVVPATAPAIVPTPVAVNATANPSASWDDKPASAWDDKPASAWDDKPSTVWDAPTAPPVSTWDDKPTPVSSWDTAPASSTWMPEKETQEVQPDMPAHDPQKDSWADMDSQLNPAHSGSVPGLLNASAMIPAPGPSFPKPAKPAIDPFADLAKNAQGRVSGDDWGSSNAPINLKPDPDISGTAVMVPSSASGEWGGEIMDASTALNAKKNSKNTPRMQLGDGTSSMEGIARWLRILSIVFLFVGSSLPASILLDSEFSPNLSQLALIIVSFLGGLLIPLTGWGVAELLTSWAKASVDLRSIRKATLGH